MINLFVDTSYKSLFLALFEDDKLIDKIQIMSEFNFSELMIPTLNELLRKNGINVYEINKIYSVVGPGSFTGIRIGLTACKVLAYILNIPIVPISSLELMASTECETDYIIPVIDARHNMVFGGIYNKKLDNIINDNYCSLKYLQNETDDPYTFVTYDENLVDSFVKPNYDITKIVSKHKEDKGLSCHAIKPNYLKKTEAEERLND